jgi:hypothetical protein
MNQGCRPPKRTGSEEHNTACAVCVDIADSKTLPAFTVWFTERLAYLLRYVRPGVTEVGHVSLKNAMAKQLQHVYQVSRSL